MMSFGDAIGETLFNYMNFRDRAARAEFWWWQLFASIVIIVAIILDILIFFVFGHGYIMPFLTVTWLALIFPSLSVTVRRLHDSGRSGWWLLLSVAFYILTVIAVFATGANDPSTRLSGAAAILVTVPAILAALAGLVILVFMFFPSNPGNNRYGPNRYAGDKY
jgi:uncharacterized membrane protein YhaH (DUF805 family)